MTPYPERLAYLRYAFEIGMSVRDAARYTGMDPWFLHQMKQIAEELKAVADVGLEKMDADDAADGEADGAERCAAGGDAGD